MNRHLLGLLLTLLVAILAALYVTGRPAAAQEDNLPPDVTERLPYFERWLGSAHADLTSPAFSYWNNLEPPLIPKGCAKCHSRTGFEDFLGVDGSPAGQVDRPHPVGTVIDCAACHNDAFTNKTTVMMPSGIDLHTAADETRCTECHQGRQSTAGIDAMIENAGASLDTVSDALDFSRTHNNPGVALKYGTAAKGGYEYAGNAYDSEFAHVPGYRTCTECHDSFTLAVRVEECRLCHTEVKTAANLVEIRMDGSAVDYNGNGNVDEGIAAEISALQAMLYQNIQTYARQVSRRPLVHTPDTYPYFFNDLNQNGQLEANEAVYDNRFRAWTPRLLRAAYNYEASLRDPGAYAHNPKYVIQLLYDSIASLNQAVWDQIDMSRLHRIDSGHFAGSEETFRHWDAERNVSITMRHESQKTTVE
ncbi:MAG TPA: polyheme membrane-associated cytochrome C [Chloroflexi bacterium]|nr:polyheme membrane-associated cytochrome C [Chloroflexota bacterium]